MNNWIDLKDHWQHLYDVAMEREIQKKNFPTAFSWKKYPSHFVGLCGEKAFSIVYNLPVNEGLIVTGDGGYDFIINDKKVNIKTTIYFRHPHLKELLEPKWWADYYFLVALDIANKRARICGWATQEELRNAGRIDYGYGQRLVINHKDLHDGTFTESNRIG